MLLPGAVEQRALLRLADAGCRCRVGSAQRAADATDQGVDSSLRQGPGAVAALPGAALQGAGTAAGCHTEDRASSVRAVAAFTGLGAAHARAAAGAPDLRVSVGHFAGHDQIQATAPRRTLRAQPAAAGAARGDLHSGQRVHGVSHAAAALSLPQEHSDACARPGARCVHREPRARAAAARRHHRQSLHQAGVLCRAGPAQEDRVQCQQVGATAAGAHHGGLDAGQRCVAFVPLLPELLHRLRRSACHLRSAASRAARAAAAQHTRSVLPARREALPEPTVLDACNVGVPRLAHGAVAAEQSQCGCA